VALTFAPAVTLESANDGDVAGADGADVFTRLRERIRATFGFDELRPMQAEAMAATLADRDALVVLPTGGGKSLCYQAPALVRDGFTIVVSPLIALMADQLRALDAVGVAAGAFNSGQDPIERNATWERLRRRELQLVYCSPERIVGPGFYQDLLALGASAVAIDEAHCISHWGHDFRPEYRQLGALRSAGPSGSGPRLPILALTATATPRVQEDIVRQLGLANEVRLVGDFDRPNLTYRITPRKDQVEDVLRVIHRHAGQAGIVYVLRRKDADVLAAALARRGVRCLAYHAGLESNDRRRIQDSFQSERIDVVVATVAFGMGIDRSDVRFVVHATLPKGVEQYSQETGRAGRDGLPAECVMFYSGADFHGWRSLMERSTAEAEAAGAPSARSELAQSLERLEKLWNFASGTSCRHRFLVEHFGGRYLGHPLITDENGVVTGGCGACDVCLGELEPVEGSQVIAQKILSCVVHCRQSYGAGHVTSILRGANQQKLRELGHDRFSTFGLLAGLETSDIRTFIDQLVSQGHLAVAPGQYPTLALTPTGVEVMRGTRALVFFRARTPKKKRTEKTKERVVKPAPPRRVRASAASVESTPALSPLSSAPAAPETASSAARTPAPLEAANVDAAAALVETNEPRKRRSARARPRTGAASAAAEADVGRGEERTVADTSDDALLPLQESASADAGLDFAHGDASERPLTAPAPLVDDPDVDHDLIEVLRALRRRLARERAVPPYLLFNDRTLVELVERRPRDRAELLGVVGIGEKKADDLGELLLGVLWPDGVLE